MINFYEFCKKLNESGSYTMDWPEIDRNIDSGKTVSNAPMITKQMDKSGQFVQEELPQDDINDITEKLKQARQKVKELEYALHRRFRMNKSWSNV